MTNNRSLRNKLLIGASLSAMLLSGVAEAQDRSGGGWDRGARGAGADPTAAAARAAQDEAIRQTQTNSSTQRALDAFRRAAQTRTQMQDAQMQARIAAQQAINNVPNGIGQGGLQAAPEIAIDPSLWVGANGPTQSAGKDGRTSVTVDQTESKAILTWDSFNVGRETDLTFNQQGADWVVLNRVRDASPSQIHGSVNAKGTVLILNQNGVLFGGASTVNVRNLVAAAADISNEQFLNRGIYSAITGQGFNAAYVPVFTSAGGNVTVEAGAQITTTTPQSVTSGGGFVLLLGKSVTNEGTISTPRGQAALSAGDDFIIRRGYGTEENQYSTTRGNEVRGLINADSASGTVINTGLIEAAQGDVTLAGRTIRQDGVLLSTTSVNQRGTIHLLNARTDGEGSVTLGKDSLTLILPELDSDEKALNSQRDALIAASSAGIGIEPATGFEDRSTLADRLDQSRIEIVTGGDVLFEGGSNISAQGGQVAVQANAGRITIADGARIDVSGVMGVALDMESNSIMVNVQGNELRDSPANRENDRLKSQNIWIDARDLVLLPDGTGGYEGDRWYTPGGLLEVGGYLANTAHGIGEWAAVGGTITLAAKEVVAHRGAVFDLSGGSLDYAAGWVNSTRVLGEDGKLYDVSTAPAWMKMLAWGDAFVRKHDRWGEAYTQVWSHPLGGARASRRWSEGYSVGRDAGKLILSAPTVVMEADILTEVINGERQTNKRADGVTDGYKLGQHTTAKAGTLAVGGYSFLGLTDLFDSDIRIGDMSEAAPALDADGMIVEERTNTVWLDAAHLSDMGLGGLELGTRQGISIEAPLTLANGGSVDLIAPVIDIAADVTARSGSFHATNLFTAVTAPGNVPTTLELELEGTASVTLREGATLDLRGIWVNGTESGGRPGGLAWLNGGSVTLESSRDVVLEAGSTIDVSSGAAIFVDGSRQGGYGGSVSLLADQTQNTVSSNGLLTLDGEVRAYGVAGGGKLLVESGPSIIIGGEGLATDGVLGGSEAAPADLVTLEEYAINAGEIMPVDYNYNVTAVLPGEVVSGPVSFTKPTLILQDWEIPEYPGVSMLYLTVGYYTPAGNYVTVRRTNASGAGPIIPAGSRIAYMFNSWRSQNNGNDLPTGYVVPEGVFEGGIPIPPVPKSIAKGAEAPMDIILPVGTILTYGTELPRPIAVVSPSTIDPALFASGFAAYEVNGHNGVVVGKDVVLDVSMPVYRFSAAASDTASGADPTEALELWTPPLYMEDPVAGQMTQRGGASLALTSLRSFAAGGTIAVEAGASVSVDPGQTIRLDGMLGRAIIDGTLNAWGGAIEIGQGYIFNPEVPNGATNVPNANSIWIGDNAVLDVAARAATAIDQHGRTYGIVRDGGTISIGGALDWEESGTTIASDAFVIVRSGAVLDASGTQARLDFATGERAGATRSVNVASNGGTIVLSSNRGIFVDGTLKANAGGAGAAGGTLAMALETPWYSTDKLDTSVRLARELVLSQTSAGSGLSAQLQPGQRDAALVYGSAGLGLDQIEAGGFDNLSLLSNGFLSFDGDVTLDMAQSLRTYAGVYALSDAAADTARVSLSAPHVLLANVSTQPGGDGFATPYVRSGAAGTAISARESNAVFAVSADLIEVRDRVGFGGSRTPTAVGLAQAVDRRGFGAVDFSSAGDIRMLRAIDTSQAASTSLSARNLKLTAAQIYPATGASASLSGDNLVIARTPGTNPSMPLSVFGTLSLGGTTIEQGGIVRAPLGAITVGSNGSLLGDGQTVSPGSTVRFLPGSETSISGAGIVLPYGGTVDGIQYFYNGSEVRLKDASGLNTDLVVYSGLDIAGLEIDVQQGALLDLSGGGDLLGGAFISGRGGSVDVLRTAFANVNPAYSFSSPDNEVYAIVPGHSGYAPIAPDAGAGNPAIGRQITIPEGVPGLPAGTYTLMPSTYALMEGAFRVEIGAASSTLGKVTSVDGMTYIAPGTLSTMNTGLPDAMPNAVFITAGKAVRNYSAYNETSYNEFVLADAARRGVLRAPLTSDAGTLDLIFEVGAGRGGRPAFTFDGKALFAPEPESEGFTGAATVSMRTYRPFEIAELEIIAPDASPNATPGVAGASIDADALNAIDAPSLAIQGGSSRVILRSGATLSAGEVALIAGNIPSTDLVGGGIIVEQGATISTIGKGMVSRDADDGYLRDVSTALILSNGNLNVRLTGEMGPAISIGTCASGDCEGETRLVAEGTMALATTSNFELADNVRYGARKLVIATSSINFGGDVAIAEAIGAGALPPGVTINQTVLNSLLSGNTAINAPAVETLVLNASQSVNFYGAVDIDTAGTGASSLDRLELGAPALYGYGAAGDTAKIATGEFVWASVMDGDKAAAPGAAVADRLGQGGLDIVADRIVIGNGVNAQPQSTITADRMVAGFGALNLAASEQVLFEGRNRIGVYQAQGDYVADKGFAYSGGSLTISSPLITSAAGGVTSVTSGGAVRLIAPAGAATDVDHEALGGELRFVGNDVEVDTTIALHSGKLTLEADSDVTLGDHSLIDLSGREIALFDVKKYSWGGDLSLISASGDIRQAAGSIVDLSAVKNAAGTMTASALGETAGTVDLAGAILGSASGEYDAGGTMVPFDAAELSVEAQSIADFAGLNTRLTASGVTGARRFHIKQGDLVVGDEVKAREVEIFTDGGSLTIGGTIDASGFQVGSIRLGALGDLTVNGTLDAHGTGVRRDSYGKIIESPNRAIIDLTSREGMLRVNGGAVLDLRYGTDTASARVDALGTLTLNAPRIGTNDVGIAIGGTPTIGGAKLVAVNAFRIYDDAPLASNPDVTGSRPQVVTQAYLDAIDAQSQSFINAAVGNGDLSARLSGLGEYHLRPGVEIASNAITNPDGNIDIRGDLDLSGYRYGPNANRIDPALRGYGEPGALVIRASGDLSVRGSINDGFDLPLETPDDVNSWVLTGYKGWDGNGAFVTPFGQEIVVPIDGVVLDAGTSFAKGATLNYDLPASAFALPAGTSLPVAMTLSDSMSLASGTVLVADILNADGSLAYAAGTILSQNVMLAAGMKLDSGTRLPADAKFDLFIWPKGVPLPVNMTLSEPLTLAVGSVIPSMTSLKLVNGSAKLRPMVDGRQGRNWAVAPMLGEGSSSWDMRIVAGADLDAVDTRMVRQGKSGNLTFADTHVAGTIEESPGGYVWGPNPYFDEGTPVPTWYFYYYCQRLGWCVATEGTTVFQPERPLMSVVRTGTGDLDLLAAGDVRVRSLYGIYTAGVNTSVGGDDAQFNQQRGRFNDGTILGATNGALEPVLADYQAWYPGHGGNLLVSAGRNIVGDQIGAVDASWEGVALYDSADVGNWLWRQGTGSAVTGENGDPTAWWINFGTYAVTNKARSDLASVVGFTGFGALGGGNVVLRAGGDAGMLDEIGSAISPIGGEPAYARSQALVVAIGSTGRVIDNGDGVIDASDLILTGGGDLDVKLGGTWNPNGSASLHSTGSATSFAQEALLNGSLVNLRGNVQLESSAVGTFRLSYGNVIATTSQFLIDPFTPSNATGFGGIGLTLGDATSYLGTRGDLVLGTSDDAGRAKQYNSAAFSYGGADYLAGGVSWFTLWTANTAIDLFSAGGDLSPTQQPAMNGVMATDGHFVYPSTLRAVAASGNIFYGVPVIQTNGSFFENRAAMSLMLAPSPTGQLEILTGDSIHAHKYSINISGADVALPTPFDPAFAGWSPSYNGSLINPVFGNAYITTSGNFRAGTGLAPDTGIFATSGDQFPLFAFGANSVANGVIGDAREPSRFYAVNGDIVNVTTGERITFGTLANASSWYEAGGPVHIRAGRDILGLGKERNTISFSYGSGASAYKTGSLFVHDDPNDVSVISAGQDIRFARVEIAGPGALEISAGRSILQEDQGLIQSLGPVARGDGRPGASIALTAGIGAQGLDYGAIRDRYLDPAKLLVPNPDGQVPPLEGSGKVAKFYGEELVDWMGESYGFTGSFEEALAAFDALPTENRTLFLRQVYFAELREGGREYNDADGPRFGSYLRGRDMIATLFPDKDADGNEIERAGDIIMFGGSGVRTLGGGDISLMAPGGQIIVGVQGEVPPSTAGIVTQGRGDISTFSESSLLLGLSRIMTTFGGSILGWSEEGDINAGRGAKTTIVFTPPRRVYDSYGNVTLSPQAPSSGAGIATLNPIPEIEGGDIDLIAPLGTIDAGEAGIRVSGNINLAALQVLNAANIQVQGEATGIPQAVVVNTGALTAASSATSAVVNEASRLAEQARPRVRTEVPVIVQVRLLGFGEQP